MLSTASSKFVKTLLMGCTFALFTAAATDSAQAQFRGFDRNDGLRLLASEPVQKELDLVDDQIQQVRDLQQEQRDAFREMFSGMRDRFRDMDREERQEAMQEIGKEMGELNAGFKTKADEILLPHQTARLEQLRLQSEARRAGGAERFLASDTIAEKLNITPEQQKAMKAKADEIRKSVQEKIAEIKAEAQDELLSVLTPEQQTQYREMVGTSFEFPQEERRGGWGRGGRGGRGGGGGRGGRGGDGGGGRGGRGGDGGNRGEPGGGGEAGGTPDDDRKS